MKNNWRIDSWKNFPCKQLDFYPFNSAATFFSTQAIKTLPEIVKESEINQLKNKISEIFNGNKSFVFHGGYCAEGFSDTNFEYVNSQTNLINTVESIIEKKFNISVVKIARMAGQYGKPRTNKNYIDNGRVLFNYHGDIINSIYEGELEREPNSFNMLIAYANSKKIYHYLTNIQEKTNQLVTNPIYTSHEAFLLPYEEAMTRNIDGHWYNLSAHLLWIGYRSMYNNSPHIEYMRGIANPVGIKLGPEIDLDFLVNTIKQINSDNLPNKVIIIYRFGCDLINKLLPHYITGIENNKLKVMWMCDPMHGNTEVKENQKLRYFKKIEKEIEQAFEIHHKLSVPLSGVHLECSGKEIYECPDDEIERPIEAADSKKYTSLMDPRLNSQQTYRLVKKIANCEIESAKVLKIKNASCI